MKKINYQFFILFAVVSIGIFGIAVDLKERLPLSGNMPPEAKSNEVSTNLAIPTNDDKVITNATSGYYFSMPSNWYTEQSTDDKVIVYPDYDPKSGNVPDCKLEMSELKISTANLHENNLDSWLTQYLHADPTASVTEISRAQINIGTSSAIEWRGILNGVTTTLVYVALPKGEKNGNDSDNILEIAPSTLSEASDADNDDCDFDLQALIANLKFGNYEP